MGNLVTGKVRFSYANVFEPRDDKYSVMILIPKSDTATVNSILAEIEKAEAEGMTSKFGGIKPPNSKGILHDGDGVKPNSGEPYSAECKGHYVLNASSNNRPEVIDVNLNAIMSKSDFYSGCYGRVSLRFYPFNSNGKKGVGCGLANIQKLEDGEALDGRTTALEDFGVPVAGQPVQPQAPVGQPVYQQPVQPQTVVNPTVIGQPTVPNIYGIPQ